MVSPTDIRDFVVDGMNGSWKWRLTVSLLLIGLCAGGVWLMVTKADADDVVQKSDVVTLKAEVDQIKQAVQAQQEDTNDVLLGLIAAEMRAAAASRCSTRPGEREFQNKRIAELQAKYAKRTGSKYDLPECSEL
jgi:hypothetical protein